MNHNSENSENEDHGIGGNQQPNSRPWQGGDYAKADDFGPFGARHYSGPQSGAQNQGQYNAQGATQGNPQPNNAWQVSHEPGYPPEYSSASGVAPGAEPGPGYMPEQGQGAMPDQGQGPMQGPMLGPMPPVQEKPKRTWSTGAVVALMVGAVILASGTTYALSSLQPNTEVANTLESAPTPGEEAASDRLEESGAIAQVASRVTNSVVQIQVQSSHGGEEGSGSIFTNDGMILTNNHVVGSAARGGAKIQVVTADGRTLPATFVAADPQTDIAVIKADGATDLQPIEMGDSNALNVGETVVAIGSPLGLSSTVTSGIVSAKDRPVQAAGEDGGESSLIDAIQTDAAINPGNSGGALVNLQGELIGIPTVIATLGGEGGSGSIGLGFAIPSNQAVRVAKQLIDHGKAIHPMIGAQINTASRFVGAEVMEVTPGSPAEQAGLEPGDVVRKVDDRLIDSGVGLIAAIRSHEVGDRVKLTVLPDGRGPEKELEVTLGDESHQQD